MLLINSFSDLKGCVYLEFKKINLGGGNAIHISTINQTSADLKCINTGMKQGILCMSKTHQNDSSRENAHTFTAPLT